MHYEPEELPPDAPAALDDVTGDDDGGPANWRPLYRHGCTFGPDLFVDKMMNLVRNPNLNSNWLFRADILYDDDDNADALPRSASPLAPRSIRGMPCRRTLVRKLIPRNERRDEPLEQTCCFHRSAAADDNGPSSTVSSLVIYLPHAPTAAALPFYHPKVRGIAHLHEWDPGRGRGTVSVHVLPFARRRQQQQQEEEEEEEAVAERCAKVRRAAYHLLETIHKHGQSSAAGYVKRVQHDVVVPQAVFQDRYAGLKARHAARLTAGWAESTDPGKHVFEDLAIAAFLMELWDAMYGPPAAGRFPGFVDIGCGNGLLVHLLNREGYRGWGFDARARKSWAQYADDLPPASAPAAGSAPPPRKTLEQRLLLPSVLPDAAAAAAADDDDEGATAIHDGLFPPGTFIVSNHADELTPWTPILGAVSRCPFAMIPCCSHGLDGRKFRAPPPRDPSKPRSTYASLVDWVARIADDCGWEVETEMLRIPSTRNTCLLARRPSPAAGPLDIPAVLRKHGGADGYRAAVAKLAKSAPRGH